MPAPVAWGSFLVLSLLGALLAAWRAALGREAGARAREARERFLVDSVRTLVDASRESSDAVLTALARALRELEPEVEDVLVFAPVGSELHCRHASGARAEHFRHLCLRRDDVGLLPAKAAASGCRARWPQDGAALMPTDRCALAVPMLDVRGLHGVAYISSSAARGAPAADTVVRVVECAATPYAMALEREADRADATYDGLTGLLSPRAFRRLLHDELERETSTRDRVLSLWFIDTDRFKRINDGFGHPAGDAVLVGMASLLQAHLVADLDVGARNGGDEFCALVRGVTQSAALERARAFCEAIRAHDFGVPVRVTASIGVATFPNDASNAAALLETADAAMYFSKRGGRDRVSFALEAGAYASLAPEAASPAPRSSTRWESDIGESRAERCLQRSCFS